MYARLQTLKRGSSYFPLLTGYWVLDTGYWGLNTGYWELGTEHLLLDIGYWAHWGSVQVFTKWTGLVAISPALSLIFSGFFFFSWILGFFGTLL